MKNILAAAVLLFCGAASAQQSVMINFSDLSYEYIGFETNRVIYSSRDSLTGIIVPTISGDSYFKIFTNQIQLQSTQPRFKRSMNGHLLFSDSSGFVWPVNYSSLSFPWSQVTGAPSFLTSINSSQVTSALGFTPVTNVRTITINGVTQDLTANRSWTVGDVSTSGSYSNPSWITALANTKITYSGTTSQYVRGDGSLASFPAVGTGTVTSVGVSSNYLTVGSTPVTTSGTISVNMPNSGITAGTYHGITFNAQGVATGAVNIAPTSVTRPINSTSFQPSLTRPTMVKYTCSISCTLTLTGGQSGTIILETSPDNSTWSEADRFTNGNTGTLTVGLSLTQAASGQVLATVPAGHYVRMRQVSTGTPTYTYLVGQETAF